jgi:hypothetical protein
VITNIIIPDPCYAMACAWCCPERFSFLPLYVPFSFVNSNNFNICACRLDSGHGGQTKDQDGDEDDGYDEGCYFSHLINVNHHLTFFLVIYPADFETNGHIVDDLMHELMVRPLPPGCRMTAIFDVSKFWVYLSAILMFASKSCHSGSALGV